MSNQPPQLPPLDALRAIHDRLSTAVQAGMRAAEAYDPVHQRIVGAALSSQAPAFAGELTEAIEHIEMMQASIDKLSSYAGGTGNTDESSEIVTRLRATLQSRQPAAPADKWSHAGYFYNAVGHALMDVKAPHGGCAKRLRIVLDELAALMGSEDAAPASKPNFVESSDAFAELAAPAEQPPYTTIDMGHGKWEVGAGKNGGLPCVAFGRNGTGKVGEPITTEPRQMSVEETFAVITFANVDGLDVLQDQMNQVREEFFPGTVCQFSKPADIRCAQIEAAESAVVASLAGTGLRWEAEQAAPVAPVAAVPEVLYAQALDALRDGLSVCMSVSVSRDRKIARDGVTLYAQTEEWCRWLDSEVGPKIRSAVDALAASPTPPVQPATDGAAMEALRAVKRTLANRRLHGASTLQDYRTTCFNVELTCDEAITAAQAEGAQR